jgi:hypothetical protein
MVRSDCEESADRATSRRWRIRWPSYLISWTHCGPRKSGSGLGGAAGIEAGTCGLGPHAGNRMSASRADVQGFTVGIMGTFIQFGIRSVDWTMWLRRGRGMPCRYASVGLHWRNGRLRS